MVSGRQKCRWRRCAAGLFLALLLGVVQSASAAEVRAQLDRQSIKAGETVNLIFNTPDPQQSLDADFSALETDFYILDQRSETQMSIRNGRQNTSVTKRLTLEPKRSGLLRVPSFSFRGGAVTPAMSLQVAAAPALAEGELPPVIVELELTPQEGPYYVHAQFALVVRVLYQQNLTEAKIEPPAPSQATIKLLSEVPYVANRSGQDFRVLERHYAIFPERSGELVIPPMELTGRLIERPTDRLWQPSVRGRRVRVASEPLTLTVAPRPASYGGDEWLPARALELSESFSDATSIRVGEPVTRTVIVDAVGLEENMLEAPVWPALEQARIYPDQPQGISRDDGQWVLGHREYRYAVVPDVPGVLELPELRLVWWDTQKDQEQVAVLPARRLEVLPAAVSAAPEAPASAEPVASLPAPGAADRVWGPAWPWQLLSAILALGWAASALLWRRPGAGASPDAAPKQEEVSAAKRLSELRQRCRANDARGAQQALLRWFRHDGPGRPGDSVLNWANGLAQEDLTRAIRDLDRAASRGGEGWQGAGLWAAFSAWESTRGQRPTAAAPLDLYAQRPAER